MLGLGGALSVSRRSIFVGLGKPAGQRSADLRRICSRSALAAAHKSGGTNAAFATAPARSEDRRHWRNLAQFVIGLIAGLALSRLVPQPDPLAGMLGPLQCGQFGAMQVLRDFPKASLEFRTRLRSYRDLVHPELDAGL